MGQSRIVLRTSIRPEEDQVKYEARKLSLLERAMEEWTAYLPDDSPPLFDLQKEYKDELDLDTNEVLVSW